MAFADVTFAAALWRGRGLTWIAADADLPPELSLTAEPVPQVSPATRPARASAPAAPRAPRASGRAPRPEARPAPQPSTPPGGTSPRWRPLAPGGLPQTWRNRLSATRPGLVAWTYWDLAQDLAAGATGAAAETGAQARSARRAFLARLLRELAHPAGTHTFWPACLPDPAQAPDAPGGKEGPFAAHPEAFWSGAAHLGCRAVIVMGSAAVRALGLPGSARPLGQLRWRGQLVLVLRELDSLAEDPARFGPTLAFLRQALGPVARPAR